LRPILRVGVRCTVGFLLLPPTRSSYRFCSAGSTTGIGLITVGVEHLGLRFRLTHLSARSAVFRLGRLLAC
jgi:hypothetical protein